MSKPDINYRSYADQQHVFIKNEKIEPPLGDFKTYDDILKFSNCKVVQVLDCEIGALDNNEDAVDINRGGTASFHNCSIWTGGKYAFTIKGGVQRVVLSDVEIVKPGRDYDIDIGNFSDQSKEKTGEVTLSNVYRTDGHPVRVRVGHAVKPLIYGGNVKVCRTASLLLKVYVFLKQRFSFIP